MNNKGFSLIELILVIAILAMLALLSTPTIINIIEKNKVDHYNSNIESILEAAELYTSNNRYNLSFNSTCTPTDTKNITADITLKTLIDNKDITSLVKNYCNDSNISNNTKIRITLSCKTREFSYNIIYDSNTNLKTKTNVTDSFGRIISGKTCKDLY